MGARAKLNRGYLNGSVIVAAVVGWIAASWLAFALTFAALLISNFCMGEIRLFRRDRHGQDKD